MMHLQSPQLSSENYHLPGLYTTWEGNAIPCYARLPFCHHKEVEAVCASYPVVYQEEPRELPVARPAYPALGE
jgi:hypothetical protein